MASTAPPEIQHRRAVRIMLVLATILAFLAIFTSWVDRQALDTNEWVNTSGKLLEDPVISDAVATYAVNELYADVDVPRLLKKRLPRGLRPISGPVAAGARQFATQAAERALQTPQVQQLWKDSNRVAHSELVSILKGNNAYVALSPNGDVVLELRPIVLQVAGQLGLERQAAANLPADVGSLQVARYEQLGTARTVTRLIQGFAWFFTFGSLALFGLAAYLDSGRRWMVLLGYGLGLVAAGLAAIAVRAALKGPFVDSLSTTEVAKAPAQHVWDIGTSLLGSIAIEVISYGVLFVIAGFLASPHPSAIGIRRVFAPTLRERPGVVWSVFTTVALIALIIFPPPGLRQLVLDLALISLAALGLVALHRMTEREFPGATRVDGKHSIGERARRAGTEAGWPFSSVMNGFRRDNREPDDVRLERLERLGALEEKGVLTDEEFRAEKQRILR
jgi:hypothetical protein